MARHNPRFDRPNPVQYGASQCILLNNVQPSHFTHIAQANGNSQNGNRNSMDDICGNLENTPLLDVPNRGRANTISDPSIWRRRSALKPMRPLLGRLPLANAGSGPRSPRIISLPLSPLAAASFIDYPPLIAKRIQIEDAMPKHALKLKLKLNKLQRLLDEAFGLVKKGEPSQVVEGANLAAEVMANARQQYKISQQLTNGLCDYVRKNGYLDAIVGLLLDESTDSQAKRECARILGDYLDAPNRQYLVAGDEFQGLVAVFKTYKEGELHKVAISIFEAFAQDCPETCSRLVEWSCLDFLLTSCKTASSNSGNGEDNTVTLRRIARALANLCLTSDHKCQQRIIDKNVANWLFLLASNQDDQTRYYACLAVCALVSNKEIEAAVCQSGTLALVEPFISAHQPEDFASLDEGRSMEWMAKLVPMLRTKRSEPRSMAAFHMAVEAWIKKDQELLAIFDHIGAVDALKEVASSPEEIAPKFARLALEIIGEQLPYKLSQQVALWSIEDVQLWVRKIGFEAYACAFYEQQVDGDLLLLITEKELRSDIGMESGLVRRRFMRELESLKMSADYSCLDGGTMDRFLASIDPRFSIYTYKLLDLGVDCSHLASLTEETLQNHCGITNSVHRKKLVQSFQGCKDMDDVELALLSKQIDVFICYRRSTGSQLASLVKVLLQLQGYKVSHHIAPYCKELTSWTIQVYIDIDRLYAGKFDCSLLKNIQAAKHFILVLTPQTLDRCFDDDECVDWVHKEISCAIQHNKNIIPILDPEFQWPEEYRLPRDIQVITRFNGIRWVHEYQEACISKLEKFIVGEINVNILTPQQVVKLLECDAS